MNQGTQYVPVSSIDPDPDQPRKFKPVEYLRDELAVSIAHEGLNNAIHLRENPDVPGRYLIVNGECRWTALTLFVKGHWEKAGRPAVDGFKVENGEVLVEAKVKSLASRRDILKNQILDNHVRLNMRPVETLRAVEGLMAEGEPMETCAKAFGMSVDVLEKDLAILRLPAKLLELYDAGELAKSVARRLAEFASEQSILKAWEWARSQKTADGQLAKIAAYDEQRRQITWGAVVKEAEPKEKKVAKAAMGKLIKAVGDFSATELPETEEGRRLLILCHSRRIEEVEKTAQEMARYARLLLDELKIYKARKKSA